MSWEVVLLEEVERWYFTLDEDAMAAVTGAIDLLALEGPTLSGGRRSFCLAGTRPATGRAGTRRTFR